MNSRERQKDSWADGGVPAIVFVHEVYQLRYLYLPTYPPIYLGIYLSMSL